MRFSLERELQIPSEEYLLAPKEEPQEVVEQTRMEENKGGRVETSTQAEPSREGRKRTREVDRLVQVARENVGSTSNFHREGR